jgi:hypothetical protein
MSRDPAKPAVPSEAQLLDYFLFGAEDVDIGTFSRATTDEVAAYFGMAPKAAFRVLDALARQGVLNKTRDIMKRHRGKTAVGYQWWEYDWKPGDLERYEAGVKPIALEESPMPRKSKREPTPEEEGAQILADAEKAGATYAQEQLNGDYFRDWVWEQMVEAERMRQNDPDSVIPIETPSDARKVARNMLQQLEQDTKRDMKAATILELSGAKGVFDVGNADWVKDKYGITYEDVSSAFFGAFDETLKSHSTRQWLGDMILETNEEVRKSSESEGLREARRAFRRPVVRAGRESTCSTQDEMEWLRDVHLPGLDLKKYLFAILYGNEDYPTRIEVYTSQNPTVDDRPTTYEPDSEGTYHRVGGGMSETGTKQTKWDVYLRGRHVDSVFYDPSMNADEVRRSLVDHDGLDPAIVVRKNAAVRESHARRRPIVRDYIAVDPKGRVVAGPFAHYEDAKTEADRARGYVRYATGRPLAAESPRARSRRLPKTRRRPR